MGTTGFRRIGAVALVVGLACPALAGQAHHDPTGETAHYELSDDPARTSAILLDGSMTATVGAHSPGPDGGSYRVNLDYVLDILFRGEKSGTVGTAVPDAYFTPGFMAALRQSGHYETPRLKIDYLGKDGGNDRIRIYDIARYDADYDLQDVEIVAEIAPGVPVLGAVTLDVTGTYQGLALRAGADYVANP